MLRLVADDLTGALDSAVRFVALAGPLPVVWGDAAPARAGGFALDLGTRDMDEAEAEAPTRRGAALLADADPGYLKLDSLLRGHPVATILACLREGGFDHAVIAPAFPAQGRLTRGGRQMWRAPHSGAWEVVGPDLSALQPILRRPGDAAVAGVSLWDAESDVDLAAIVAAGRTLSGRVLWCGSAGLAAALTGSETPVDREIFDPLLGLIGTDHPVTQGQLGHAARWHLRVRDASAATLAEIARRMAEDGAVFVTVELPDDIARHAAAEHIAAVFADLLTSLAPCPPGTLLVCGGETLRGVCVALGASALQVAAEYAPGIPVSRLIGGVWDGMKVVSKSGAFGAPDLLSEMASP